MDNQYVRWQLSATINGVHVSAASITDEHKEKTLKVWQKMRAKNVTVVERPDASPLPTWRVRLPPHHIPMELHASSKERVKELLAANKKLKQWQILMANIEQI